MPDQHLLHIIAAAAAKAPSSTMGSGLPDKQALTTLLTVESLTFAAFGIGVAVTAAVPGGRSPYLMNGKLARRIALVLTAVAVAAATAWWEVFLEPGKPEGLFAWAQALGIAVAVVGQPYFAWRVALGVKPASLKDFWWQRNRERAAEESIGS